ncbi:uncharacterized protein [Nicotiana tomentosiformis]|uniref:uncharacterized protein n=1 Tax=Nicotiana tomentosiformis TaxID=4098 RepID=UPI00388CAE85
MGTKPEKELQAFIDEMHKTIRVMCSTGTEAVELASHLLKEVAYTWFELWEESHEEESPPTKWTEFADAFIDHFLPAESREARDVEFENLKQGSMSVWDYHTRFADPFKDAAYMMPTMEARVHRFV